jgi:hypothetical protein
MTRLHLALLLCVFIGMGVFAQVFPDAEHLDVIQVTDGSILVGRVIEDVPDRYIEIELYGGSTFVVAYENIVSRRQRRNPDYGTSWIKVEIGEGVNSISTNDTNGENDTEVE